MVVINRCGYDEYANHVFENCYVDDLGGYWGEYPVTCAIYRGVGNVTLQNSSVKITIPAPPTENRADCHSGIVTTGNVVVDNCDITIENAEGDSDFDLNFIYWCEQATISNSSIKFTSSACRGNVIYKGKINITGCQLYLPDPTQSICHYNSDTTAGGTFSGNYVEYRKTYMRFGSISGNQFNHKAAGSSTSNQIILQCPTVMTGNHFEGSAVYVDGQSKKHIVDRNLHDNGLTVGSTASGSITTNNLQY